jgi:hypothetical protein
MNGFPGMVLLILDPELDSYKVPNGFQGDGSYSLSFRSIGY